MKRIPQITAALAVATTLASASAAYAADPCPGMSGSSSGTYPSSTTTSSATSATTTAYRTRHARRLHHSRRF